MASDTEQRLSSLEAAMVELAQSQTRTGQRLDEFISQSARLLGDHGERLNRIESGLESLLTLAQANERRINQFEQAIAANSEAIGSLQEVTRGNTEAIGSLQEVVGYLREISQSNNQNIQVLADLAQSNEVRFRQLAESQAGVLSRMDDVIAVMRERL